MMATCKIKTNAKLRRACRFGAWTILSAVLPMTVGCGIFNAPLAVVDSVDIDRYAGKWYEIARYPNAFERNCAGITADYTVRSDGRIDVLNTCIEGGLDGPVRTIEGVARSVDPSNAKLKVTFFWPFEGDYWILDLDADYTYAVVGDPSRSFLWILSRTPQLDAGLLDAIIEWLPSIGYDPERLIMVEQSTEGAPGQ